MAITYPTAPTAVTYSVAPLPVRTRLVTDATDLQTKLDESQYGDWIVVPAGSTLSGQFVVTPSHGGNPIGTGGDNWITIISSNYASLPAAGTRVGLADAANMPTLKCTTSAIGNRVISSSGVITRYRFVGIKFTTPMLRDLQGMVDITPVGADLRDLTKFPQYISFERCLFVPDYDFGPRVGLYLQGKDCRAVDCHFENCMQYAQGDGQAILNIYGPGPYYVNNNNLEGMGEVLFMGSASEGGPVVQRGVEYNIPKDITITNNYIAHKRQYHRADPSYVAAVDTLASGGLTASGLNVTFGVAQDFAGASTFNRVHTTGAVTSASTTIDIGTSPLTAGFQNPSNVFAWAYLGGENYFHYTGVTATGFTGCSGITSSWALGTWVSPRRVFVRPHDNSLPSTYLTDWLTSTTARTKVALATTSAWRYNKGDLVCKQVVEFKACARVLLADNVLENGFADGQAPLGGIEFLPRESGWMSDLEIRGNKLKNSATIQVGVGEASTGTGFGIPSPRSTNRVWIHDNLLEHIGDVSTATSLLSPVIDAIRLGMNTSGYGYFTSQGGGTIGLNSVATGTRTLTASIDLFHPSSIDLGLYEGMILRYTLGGEAMVVTVTSGLQMTVNVTTAFHASAVSAAASLFSIGPVDKIGTRFLADSWVMEHNTVVGANSAYTWPILVAFDEGTIYEPVQLATNYVCRDNILYAGNNPNNGSGLVGEANSSFRTGTANWASTFLESATKQIAKNALFGTGSTQFAGQYAAGEVTISESVSVVDFVDYAGGNYALKATSPYVADATSAPTIPMRGCDVAAREAVWALAVSGQGDAAPAVAAPHELNTLTLTRTYR